MKKVTLNVYSNGFRCAVMSVLGITMLCAGLAPAAELPGGTWESLGTLDGNVGWDFCDAKKLKMNDGRLFSKTYGIYDPSANSLTEIAPEPALNIQHVPAHCILPDNRYISCGGIRWYNSQYVLAPTLMYDPASDQWTELAPLPEPITSAVALPTESGEIFVAGGRDAYELAASLKTWFFNPDTDTWRDGPTLAMPLWEGDDLAMSSYPQSNLKAYVVNGKSLFSFDPANATYTQLGFLPSKSKNFNLVKTRLFFKSTKYPSGGAEHFISYYDAVTGGIITLPQLNIRFALSGNDPVYPIQLNDGRSDYHAYLQDRHPNGHIDEPEGIWRVNVLDPDTDNWVEISTYDVGPEPYVSFVSSLDDGFILFLREGYGSSAQTYLHRFRVTQDSGGTVDPYVVDDQPASLTMSEGTTHELRYHVEGRIPAGGVDVIVERADGDGDLRVLNGPVQRVYSSIDIQTVDLAALIDADTMDDEATIRMRVVFEDTTDPNARSITVNITDTVAEATHLKGDVNADGLVNIDDIDESERHFGMDANQN